MKLAVVSIALIGLIGCTVNYSFNGGSVPPGVKTIQIDYFPLSDGAPLASALTSQAFTESLRDVFLSQTKLDMVQDSGDIRLEGEIKNYSIAPINISATSETADQNRLTVGVEVRYFKMLKDEKMQPTGDTLIFKRPFQRFVDYDSNQDFASIEEDLLTEVNDQLTQDIFNATLGDW